jgi:nucleoid DNA-binding protein
MTDSQAMTPKKPMTKTEIVASLAQATQLTPQQIAGVLDELGKLIGRNVGTSGPGVFTLPGLLKITVVRKPATEARKGINPFTKLETTFQAKPARNVVKVMPLKGLKEMA